MNSENLFEQDWRDCLRAHYVHVIRERDLVNEESLITVLRQTGFTDDDISAIRSETAAALGWDMQEVVAEVEAEVETPASEEPPATPPESPADAPPVPAPMGTSDQRSQQADQPAPAEAVPPAAKVEPEQDNEPPEPESFVQMSLF